MSKDKNIFAYKGMSNKMTCRDYKFEVGEEYEHKGKVEVCRSGFHACPKPFDVFDYYPPGSSRYFTVEQAGEIKQDGDKTVSSKIAIKAEISIADMIKAHIDMVWEKVKKKCIGENEEDSGAASNSGYSGAASNSGDYGAALSTGVGAKVKTDTPNSLACGFGVQNKVMAEDRSAWIVLGDWRFNDDDEWFLKKLWTAKPGNKINGVKIEVGTWYWFEDGELHQSNS